jgi:alkaline phosphatase D
MRENRPPSEGWQFFGAVRIDDWAEVIPVEPRDLTGKILHRVVWPPEV